MSETSTNNSDNAGKDVCDGNVNSGNSNNNNNNNNIEESVDSSGGKARKNSHSTSDAERRRRRQQRILGEAGNRLSKITLIQASLGDGGGGGGGCGGGYSSSSFSASNDSSNNNNNNNNNTNDGNDNNNKESELHGSIPKQLNSRNINDKFYKNISENDQRYQERNNNFTSLASSIGGERQYPPQYQQFSLSTDDDPDIFINQQIEQMPLPFPPFLNPDMSFFSLFGDSSVSTDNNNNNNNNLDNIINGGVGDGSSSNGNSSGSVQLLLQSRLWQLIHFVSMIFLGIYFISSELSRLQGGWTRFYYLIYQKPDEILAINRIPSVSLFWYFITAELILQSTRLLLQRDQPFQGSTLGSLTENLPAPFPDIIKILLRYRLIWNSLWEDICVLVFVVGFVITISPILSNFD